MYACFQRQHPSCDVNILAKRSHSGLRGSPCPQRPIFRTQDCGFFVLNRSSILSICSCDRHLVQARPPTPLTRRSNRAARGPTHSIFHGLQPEFHGSRFLVASSWWHSREEDPREDVRATNPACRARGLWRTTRHTDKRAALHRSRPPDDQSGKRVANYISCFIFCVFLSILPNCKSVRLSYFQ